ncbi:MAG: hypothetical protein HOP27_13965 [Anaerolineales bacterium]|nr:hypothetical protein [Anaerolineales bacterium]
MKTSMKFFTGLLLAAQFLSGCNVSPNIQFECPNVETNLSSLNAKGSLILDASETFQTYLMDMNSQDMIQINKSEENLEFFEVSPGRKWMVYNAAILDENLNYLLNDIVIAGVYNQLIKSLPSEDNWGPIHWLDDERLIINLIKTGESASLNFLVLNPFTNKRQELSANYPNIYNQKPLPNWDGWGITAFNPQLDQVVYLEGDVSGPYYYTLWDIQKKEAITQIQAPGDISTIPRWSADSDKFAIAPSLFSKMGDYPSYDLFSVSRDGSTTQLTHLSDYYPWVYIGGLSWSPDSRYIAFWYSSWTDMPSFGTRGDYFLGVLDIQTGLTTNYCTHGELGAEVGSRKYQPPLWSPDSRHVIVKSQIGEDFLNFQTILVDIQKNRAFLIAEKLEPVGWLVSP